MKAAWVTQRSSYVETVVLHFLSLIVSDRIHSMRMPKKAGDSMEPCRMPTVD